LVEVRLLVQSGHSKFGLNVGEGILASKARIPFGSSTFKGKVGEETHSELEFPRSLKSTLKIFTVLLAEKS
jgi:hypothetical protein